MPIPDGEIDPKVLGVLGASDFINKRLGTEVLLTARPVHSVQTDPGYRPESQYQSWCCRIIRVRSLGAGVFGMRCKLRFLKVDIGSQVTHRHHRSFGAAEGSGLAVLN